MEGVRHTLIVGMDIVMNFDLNRLTLLNLGWILLASTQTCFLHYLLSLVEMVTSEVMMVKMVVSTVLVMATWIIGRMPTVAMLCVQLQDYEEKGELRLF